MPFATIVTGDHYDRVSKLDGRDAHRLNIGRTNATYKASFGDPPTERDEDGALATGADHAPRCVPKPTDSTRRVASRTAPGV